jgi:hemerythrin-like domain-containing protein
MKKVTLSVAALTIAMSSYGQCVASSSDSITISQESIQAESVHDNLRDIVYKAEDMLTAIKQDVDSGYIYEEYAEFYENMLSDVIKLAATIEIND